MKSRILASLSSLLLTTLLLASCGADRSADQATDNLPIIQLGPTTLKLELALSQSEQRTGLMHREGIAEDQGMLFVYDEPTQMSFWMKNVDFPIHIGFFTADGVLREIYPMYANDTGSRKSRRGDMLYALEVSKGWFSRNGVKTGDQLDIEAVKQAIAKKRGR